MFKLFLASMVIVLCGGCGSGEYISLSVDGGEDSISLPPGSSVPEYGGGESVFKVPVPQGYDWEVTQSWASHCSECGDKYTDWDYCSLSHQSSCCKYGIDFNLPGTADVGKPVLASKEGIVKDVGYDNGWGYYLVIDHGQNFCTRYAHMLQGSTNHLTDGDVVCQGLKIGEIGNTGASEGSHLHFQFEDCSAEIGMGWGFGDGNGVIECVRGNDRYDQYGNYTAMLLTNVEVQDCAFSSPLGGSGWQGASCGALPGCPLNTGCGRQGGHKFSDYSSTNPLEAEAAAYLWSECAIDGANGMLKPKETITRAEALKISLFLFGLKDNCNGFESFGDVGPLDWFYPVVLCGLHHGIITSEHSLFHPNDKASIAEASKMVVEAAAKAGVIDIKNPSVGNFLNIGKSHWAYPYVETLLFYGGLLTTHTAFNPNTPIQRGDFTLMAASMSPCFCQSINCAGSCVCDQKVFACVDPNDSSGGTGGVYEPEPEPEPVCVPDCLGKSCGLDGCGSVCGSCPYDHTCENSSCVPIPCVAQTTCAELGKECGYVSDNCNEWMNCGSCSSGETCQEGQCVCTDCGGGGGVDSCPPYATLINGLCDMGGWFCDPLKGYEITLSSPDGSYHILMGNGPFEHYYSPMWPVIDTKLNLNCDMLPLAILIKAGQMDTVIIVEDQSVPDFDVWVNYPGIVTLEPLISPSQTTKVFQWPEPKAHTLIRIPTKF